MDSRLEKIRQFKGTIMDFEEYINSRIAETKKENMVKESLDFTLEEEPKYSLCRCFGDPTAVICYVTYCLRETNNQDKIEEFRQKAIEGNYHQMLVVAMEYLDMCNASVKSVLDMQSTEQSSEEKNQE